MSYIRGLDGLRAIAVLMVMAHHKFYMVIPDHWALGKTGVSLFFCLSGFLIIGILNDRRKLCERGESSVSSEVNKFYARRFLRLTPIYLLYLLVALALTTLLPGKYNYSGFFYHFTYTTNFWVGFVEHSWSNIFGHLWSLAVEEQFYLLAAPLILLTPSKKHVRVLAGFIIVGVCSYIALKAMAASTMLIYVFPTVSFALIAMGGCIVFAQHEFNRYSFVVGACMLILSTFFLNELHMPPYLALISTYLGCYLVVGYIVSKQSSYLVSFLELRWLVFIGRISYGLYVYHIVIPFRSLGGTYIPRLLWGGEYNFILGYTVGAFVYIAVAILIAYASWRLIESPILKLKKKF
jgi:peptidoglycan/LPS O-acetylase OafA/YrhL